MAEASNILGKADWISEFLLRVEASVIETAKSLNEESYASSLIETFIKQGRYFEFLSSPEAASYFNQEHIKKWTKPTSLSELCEHKANGLTVSGVEEIEVIRTPHPIFVRILQNMTTGSQGNDSSQCNPLDLNSSVYKVHVNRISQALKMHKSLCPVFHQIITTFLRKLIFVDNKSSFRGATSYYARGLSYFRPLDSWDKLVWAEELLHEATHNQMKAYLTFDKLVIGENRLKPSVPGPLRKDIRHNFGNFQALHVISRLLKLNTALIQHGIEEDRLSSRNSDLLEKCKVPFASLKSTGQFSDLGQYIFDTEIEPTFN